MKTSWIEKLIWLGLGLSAFGLSFSCIFGMFNLLIVAGIFICITLLGIAITVVSLLIAIILMICNKGI